MSQYGNETMQFAVDLHLTSHLGAEQFQAAVVIVQVQSGQTADQPVEDFAGIDFVPWIEASLFPSVDDIEARVDLFQQHWEFRRIVLQIGVEHQNQITMSRLHAGRQSSRLAEVATQPNSRHVGVSRGKRLDCVPRFVG